MKEPRATIATLPVAFLAETVPSPGAPGAASAAAGTNAAASRMGTMSLRIALSVSAPPVCSA